MIEYKRGDIFEEDAEALVNSVNCVGVMGRGIALQFKRKYPANFKAYQAACEREEVKPGRMFVFETGCSTNPRFVINFPTKIHWRGKSRLEYIETGLDALAEEIKARNIRSIAIPPLGTDLGKLNWADVRPLIEATVKAIDCLDAIVFKPGSASISQLPKSVSASKMTVARAVLIRLIYRYLKGLLDPFVTLLEVHKLMYFMQEAGEPLRLAFVKETYGPYAQNLRHLLRTVEGHMIYGYNDGGDEPHKQLTLAPSALTDSDNYLVSHPESKRRLDRVTELIEGFETPFGLELLATVHWVTKEYPNATESDIVAQTHSWSDRKRQFSERQILLALRTLRNNGFIPPAEGEEIPLAFQFADGKHRLEGTLRFEGM